MAADPTVEQMCDALNDPELMMAEVRDEDSDDDTKTDEMMERAEKSILEHLRAGRPPSAYHGFIEIKKCDATRVFIGVMFHHEGEDRKVYVTVPKSLIGMDTKAGEYLETVRQQDRTPTTQPTKIKSIEEVMAQPKSSVMKTVRLDDLFSSGSAQRTASSAAPTPSTSSAPPTEAASAAAVAPFARNSRIISSEKPVSIEEAMRARARAKEGGSGLEFLDVKAPVLRAGTYSVADLEAELSGPQSMPVVPSAPKESKEAKAREEAIEKRAKELFNKLADTPQGQEKIRARGAQEMMGESLAKAAMSIAAQEMAATAGLVKSCEAANTRAEAAVAKPPPPPPTARPISSSTLPPPFAPFLDTLREAGGQITLNAQAHSFQPAATSASQAVKTLVASQSSNPWSTGSLTTSFGGSASRKTMREELDAVMEMADHDKLTRLQNETGAEAVIRSVLEVFDQHTTTRYKGKTLRSHLAGLKDSWVNEAQARINNTLPASAQKISDSADTIAAAAKSLTALNIPQRGDIEKEFSDIKKDFATLLARQATLIAQATPQKSESDDSVPLGKFREILAKHESEIHDHRREIDHQRKIIHGMSEVMLMTFRNVVVTVNGSEGVAELNAVGGVLRDIQQGDQFVVQKVLATAGKQYSAIHQALTTTGIEQSRMLALVPKLIIIPLKSALQK